jgi:membrane protein YdbS with pleckstrin-like domain
MASYPYSKQAFLPNLLLLLALTVIALLLTSSTSVDPALGAAVMLLLLAAVLVLGVSPILTSHELLDDALVLRQGWYFRAVIPLSNILGADLVEFGPRKVGVSFRLAGPVVSVTTRKHNVIELTLRRPQSFAWAMGKRADHVIFDAVDDRRLLENLRRSFSPVEADGARAKLWD